MQTYLSQIKTHSILSLTTRSLFILIASLGLAACGGGGGDTAPAITQSSPVAPSIVVKQAALAVGNSNCTNGGIQIESGLDNNLNGVLDSNEISNVQNVCNGLNGSDGNTALVNLISEAAGTNCPAGGKRFQSGKDIDNNGSLDASEITSSAYLCNGENGQQGSNGSNSLISSSDEASGNNCLLGGKRFDSGIDLNNDGVLQASEINATSYLCSSSNGSTPVFQPLLRVDNEPSGSNCPYGGSKISSGLDSNTNAVLESSEVSQVSYGCNRGNVLVSTTAEPPGVNCSYGGTRLDAGSDINTNTILDTSEISSTTYVCDDAQDSLVWSKEIKSMLRYENVSGLLNISVITGRGALAGDENGNAFVVASGQGLVNISGLLKGVKSPVPFNADLSFVSSPSNSSFSLDMLFPAVAAASSPNGKHAIAAYAKLNYPASDFSILLQRFDLTNLQSFAVTPESVDDGIKEVYPDLVSQTVTDLKAAVNDNNATTLAWVENGYSARGRFRGGKELWVNAYRFAPLVGFSWAGAQKLLTADTGVQIQNLLINSSGNSMLIYYDMSYETRTSMSFRYMMGAVGTWLATTDRVLASNLDGLERVRILYYKNQQLYANYFDLNSQVWGSAQLLFAAGTLSDFGPDGRTNIVVNRQGDVAASDINGFVYYFDVSTGVTDKRFLPSAFPLVIDENGVAMYGLDGNTGEDMATLSYYPQSGWGGTHRVDYISTTQNGKPPIWFFDPYGNANSVASAGTFRLMATFESSSTIPDLLSAPKAWSYRVFVSALP